MSRDKHIVEIKECIDAVYGADCTYFDVGGFAIANEIYNAGYRKSSELAREIFEEIATILRHYDMLAERDKSEYGELIVMDIGCAIAELKKKYTESEKDNG